MIKAKEESRPRPVRTRRDGGGSEWQNMTGGRGAREARRQDTARENESLGCERLAPETIGMLSIARRGALAARRTRLLSRRPCRGSWRSARRGGYLWYLVVSLAQKGARAPLSVGYPTRS